MIVRQGHYFFSPSLDHLKLLNEYGSVSVSFWHTHTHTHTHTHRNWNFKSSFFSLKTCFTIGHPFRTRIPHPAPVATDQVLPGILIHDTSYLFSSFFETRVSADMLSEFNTPGVDRYPLTCMALVQNQRHRKRGLKITKASYTLLFQSKRHSTRDLREGILFHLNIQDTLTLMKIYFILSSCLSFSLDEKGRFFIPHWSHGNNSPTCMSLCCCLCYFDKGDTHWTVVHSIEVLFHWCLSTAPGYIAMYIRWIKNNIWSRASNVQGTTNQQMHSDTGIPIEDISLAFYTWQHKLTSAWNPKKQAQSAQTQES